MTIFDVIKKDYLSLSGVVKSRAKKAFLTSSLKNISKDYQIDPSPINQRKLKKELENSFSLATEEIKKGVEDSARLGLFHTAWLSEKPFDKKIDIVNRDFKIPNRDFSRLFNERRKKARIKSEAISSSTLLDNGFSLNQIAGRGKHLNYDLDRIWRTESHQAYNKTVREELLKEGGLLQAIEILDERTRDQSLFVNQTISNERGEFLYPDGGRYILGNSGNPAWDINERGVALPYLGSDMRKKEVNEELGTTQDLANALKEEPKVKREIKAILDIIVNDNP